MMMPSTAAANIRRKHSQAPSSLPDQHFIHPPRKRSSISVRDPVAEKRFEIIFQVLKKNTDVRERFRVAFPKWEQERRLTLSNFEIILQKLQRIQNRSSTASLIGKSVGATGGVAAIIGTILLPVTLGLSSAVVAGGAIIGLSASASTLGAKAIEYTAVRELLGDTNFHLRWDYYCFRSLLSWLLDVRDEKGTKLGDLLDWLLHIMLMSRPCGISSVSYDEYLSFLISQLNLSSFPNKLEGDHASEIWEKAEPIVREHSVKKSLDVPDSEINVDVRKMGFKRRSKSLMIPKDSTETKDAIHYDDPPTILTASVKNYKRDQQLSASLLNASLAGREKWCRKPKKRSKSCFADVPSVEDVRNSERDDERASLILEESLEMSNTDDKMEWLKYSKEIKHLAEVFTECAQKYKMSQKLSKSMTSLPRSTKTSSHLDKKSTTTIAKNIRQLSEAFAAERSIYEILYTNLK